MPENGRRWTRPRRHNARRRETATPYQRLFATAAMAQSDWQPCAAIAACASCDAACIRDRSRVLLESRHDSSIRRARAPMSLAVARRAAAPGPTAAGVRRRSRRSARPGCRRRIEWTFNFDAGWGTFGFANSLFNNPKEPGVDEDLSDQWFEGYVKPALSANLHDRHRPARSTARSASSASARTARCRSSSARRLVVRARGPLHRLAIGHIADARRERRRLHRRTRAIPPRARLSALRRRRRRRQPRRLLDERPQSVRVRRDRPLQAGPHTVETFYLDKDELDESDSGSRLWGTNYEVSIGEATTLGATYMKWFAHADDRARDATG